MNFDEADALNETIRAIGIRHRALAIAALAPLGIHPGHKLLLLELESEGPRTQAQLAAASGYEPPTITLSVRQLETAGLVVRRPSPTDGRATIVELTSEAHRLPAPGPTFAGIEPSHPVMVLREGSLAAVASRISLLEFGETPLRAHLADAEWVERTSRAHERALEQIHSQAAVIPIRMCTVYRTEGGVRERLRREAHSLEHALSHLRGKDEFGVKVFADLHRGIGAGGADPPLSEQSGSGRMPYLIEEACARVHEQLCAVATDGLVAPSEPFAAEAHAGELILNGVYLVEDRSREAFDNEVRELGRELGRLGIELQATGPWAAYNFVPGAIGAAW